MSNTTQAVPATSPHPTGGLWREEVLDRAGRLGSELRHLAATAPVDPEVVAAGAHLAQVDRLVEGRLRPAEWWSGSRVEDCWHHLRMAEEGILAAGTEREVLARVKEAGNHAAFYLGADDRRTKDLVAMLESGTTTPVDMVPTARIALQASHEAGDRQHRERRAFVNTLRVTAGVLVLLAALLLVAVRVWEWEFVPAVGDQQQPALVGLAMLFGAVGALFSAVPSLAQMPSAAQTFSPVRAQAVLKVVVGAWSAVVGLMAVTAGLSEASTVTLAGFAMVAALFGASQEALTRFADHKAAGLDSAGSSSG